MGEDQVILLGSKLIRYCTVAFLLLCSLFSSKAQEYNDYGSWDWVHVSFSPAEKLGAFGRLEYRSLDHFQGLNQVFFRAGLQYKPVKWLRLDSNFDYAYTPTGSKLRFLPGFNVSGKVEGVSLYWRQWLMHTWNVGKDTTSDTFRSKFGVSKRIGDTRFTPHVDYEIFYWGDKVTQHRFFAGTKIRMSDSLTFATFYLYQLYPLKQSGYHLLGLGLNLAI